MASMLAQSDQLKSDLLRSHGYEFSFERLSYVNRQARKVFSYEFVDDHSEAEIEACIQRPSSPSWTFFFNDPPAEAMRPVLEAVFTTGRIPG